MKFLLDQNQSPTLAAQLRVAGHDAVQVRDIGLAEANDTAVLTHADDDGPVLMSGDTAFGELLARTNASSPPVILLRRQQGRHAAQVASSSSPTSLQLLPTSSRAESSSLTTTGFGHEGCPSPRPPGTTDSERARNSERSCPTRSLPLTRPPN